MKEANNNVPQHWEYKRLGDMFDFVGGGTPSKKQADFWNGNIFWASVKDVKGDFLNKTQDLITEKGLKNSASNLAEKNDVILITRISPGKSIIANVQTAINQDLKIAKPKFNTIPKFIHYFFNSIERECIKNSSGTTVLGITLNNLNELKIPDLPLPEQVAIVNKIEELFSELENGKEQLLTAQRQLKIYRQSLLKAAFGTGFTRLMDEQDYTKKSDNSKSQNLKNYTNSKSLPNTKSRKSLNPVNPDADSDLPEGWKWVTLEELVDKISDGPFGSNLKSIDYVNEGIRVIRLENIGEMEFRDEYKTFVTLEKYNTIKNHTVRKGDIIFSSFIIDNIRSVILPDYIDKAINKADCFLVRVSDSKIIKKYLAYYFSTKAMRNQLVNQIHGATRPRINTTQLKKSLIPLPPLPVQQAIVEILESKLTVCDKLEETISHSLQQVETLRQSILKKAFEGRLV